MADGCHIGKRRFVAVDSPIFAKLCMITLNPTEMTVEYHKFPTLKIQNGGRPPS